MGISKEDSAEIKKDIKQILAYQAADAEYKRINKPRCERHSEDIQDLKKWRNIFVGAYIVVAARLGLK